MKLFEYEAKDILKEYDITVPEGGVADNPSEAEAVASQLSGPVAVKAQVLVAGRGKAGGIQFADNASEARKTASDLLNITIKGIPVTRLLIEKQVVIQEQYYASVVVHRQARRYVALASMSGGVDIEEVAQSSPNAIVRHPIDFPSGFDEQEARAVIGGFAIDEQDAAQFASILHTLYQIALDYDAELVEINPLVKTTSGEFIAADAKIIIDDNAVFRHQEFAERGSVRAEDTPRETEARKQGLTYVDLDGDIGIVCNGAGLTMATIDVVHMMGGKPANFLDLGGSVTVDSVSRAVTFIISKPGIQSMLVNILGGVTRCDLVAQGIVVALSEAKDKIGIVVRMMGTNEEEGARILQQAGISVSSDMEEAVRQAIALQGQS